MNNIDGRIQSGEHIRQEPCSSVFGIVGLGNIGRATVLGLMQSGLLTKEQLWISNRTLQITEGKCSDLIDIDKVTLAKDNKDLVQNCSSIIIALKQGQMRDELLLWKESNILDNDKLLISFAAGIRIDTIKKWVGNQNQPVIRVMPNTPVAVGKGVFGWTVSDEVTVGQIKIIQRMLSNLGTEYLVRSDKEIDAVTAISGSGPAYFYLLAEYMSQEAQAMGIKLQDAENLVRETFIGAAALLDKADLSFSDLRQKITSKGGTTEKAVNSFNSDSLSLIVKKAMENAKDRGEELGHYFDSL